MLSKFFDHPELFAGLYDFVPGNVLILKNSGEILSFNANMVQVRSFENLTAGKPFFDCLFPEIVGQFTDFFVQILQKGIAEWKLSQPEPLKRFENETRMNVSSSEPISYLFRGIHFPQQKIIGIHCHDQTSTLEKISKLTTEAYTDPLTGLLNRRKFQQDMEQLPGLSSCLQALIGIDIDFFKKVNDTYGHAAGDSVLKLVAQRCSDLLRHGDLFARFGGEEFYALALVLEPNQAIQIAQKLCDTINAAPCLFSQKDEMTGIPRDYVIPVTISLGVAIRKESETLEELCQRTDAALYKAKETGRNKVVFAETTIFLNNQK